MFHTIIHLRPDRDVRVWLRNPRHVHQRLCLAWPDGERDARLLWRAYPDRILLRSHDAPPILTRLCVGFDPFAAPPHVEPYDPQLHEGAVYRFGVLCDPVICTRRRKQALRSEADIGVWIGRKSMGWGAQLLDGLRIERHGPQVFKRAEDRDEPERGAIVHGRVEISGRLVLRDAKAMHDALAAGVGPGKAFGLGMLLIEMAAACV